MQGEVSVALSPARHWLSRLPLWMRSGTGSTLVGWSPLDSGLPITLGTPGHSAGNGSLIPGRSSAGSGWAVGSSGGSSTLLLGLVPAGCGAMSMSCGVFRARSVRFLVTGGGGSSRGKVSSPTALQAQRSHTQPHAEPFQRPCRGVHATGTLTCPRWPAVPCPARPQHWGSPPSRPGWGGRPAPCGAGDRSPWRPRPCPGCGGAGCRRGGRAAATVRGPCRRWRSQTCSGPLEGEREQRWGVSRAGGGTPAGTALPRAARHRPSQQHGSTIWGTGRLQAAWPCQGCAGQRMQWGQHGVRQGSSEPRAPRWHCQNTESISYLTPSSLGSRLGKERERERIYQGNGKGTAVLSLPRLWVRYPADATPRPVMLPMEMELTWVLWGHPQPGLCATHPTAPPSPAQAGRPLGLAKLPGDPEHPPQEHPAGHRAHV